MTINPIKGGFGDDNLVGTSGNDIFNLARGGNDTVDAGGGNDIFWMAGTRPRFQRRVSTATSRPDLQVIWRRATRS